MRIFLIGRIYQVLTLQTEVIFVLQRQHSYLLKIILMHCSQYFK